MANVPSNLEINRIPCISTAHLDRDTAKLLTEEGDDNLWIKCASYDEGFFLYVKGAQHLTNDVPRCLLDLAIWSETCGHGWIQLDRDAEKVVVLPHYDW